MSGTRSERVRGTRVSSECVRGDRVRVLIVDDEPALTELLAVAEAGWQPYPVADGHSGPHAVVFAGGGNLWPPMTHTVRGVGYAIRPVEDGR